MKIGFLCPSASRRAGGIFEIERRLAQCLVRIPGTAVETYSLRDQFTQLDLPAWQPLVPKAFASFGPAGWGYSPGLSRAFGGFDGDLGHLHALWMFTSILIYAWSRKTRRPYLVSTNGMLDPWALKHSALKKKIAGVLYERRMLNGAACLQANSIREAEDLRALGLRSPIAVIPNGVDLPCGGTRDGELRTTDYRPWSVEGGPWAGQSVLLYLGRIHPKKGLANLIRAWGALTDAPMHRRTGAPSSDWLLAIAGWDQGGHESELKRLATELGIGWADIRSLESGDRSLALSTAHRPPSLVFIGPQFNEDKAACFRSCDAFILPSFSEGLPMAVLEAWSYAKPVLMTPQCNLPEGFAADAALRIEPTPESIKEGLRSLLRAPRSALQAMGQNGRRLVAERFTWEQVAREMRSVYEWVLGGGPKPGCVVG